MVRYILVVEDGLIIFCDNAIELFKNIIKHSGRELKVIEVKNMINLPRFIVEKLEKIFNAVEKIHEDYDVQDNMIEYLLQHIFELIMKG